MKTGLIVAFITSILSVVGGIIAILAISFLRWDFVFTDFDLRMLIVIGVFGGIIGFFIGLFHQ